MKHLSRKHARSCARCTCTVLFSIYYLLHPHIVQDTNVVNAPEPHGKSVRTLSPRTHHVHHVKSEFAG